MTLAFSLPSLAAAADFSACIKALSEDAELKMNKKALEKFFSHFKTYGSSISNKRYGVLIDYKRPSTQKRSYLIDIKNCDVVSWEYVIHGGQSKETKAGDPDSDGDLDKCTHSNGSRTNMTRPGPFVTDGCHETAKKGWKTLWKEGKRNCQGIRLNGFLAGVNDPNVAAGVVMHEHIAVKNDGKIKPVGQGCPTYAPDRLKAKLRYKLQQGTLIYIFAPQCGNH